MNGLKTDLVGTTDDENSNKGLAGSIKTAQSSLDALNEANFAKEITIKALQTQLANYRRWEFQRYQNSPLPELQKGDVYVMYFRAGYSGEGISNSTQKVLVTQTNDDRDFTLMAYDQFPHEMVNRTTYSEKLEEFCAVLCENYGGWRWSILSWFWTKSLD